MSVSVSGPSLLSWWSTHGKTPTTWLTFTTGWNRNCWPVETTRKISCCPFFREAQKFVQRYSVWSAFWVNKFKWSTWFFLSWHNFKMKIETKYVEYIRVLIFLFLILFTRATYSIAVTLWKNKPTLKNWYCNVLQLSNYFKFHLSVG